MKTYLVVEELRLYLYSTDSCLTKLKRHVQYDNHLEVDRLKAIIEYQRDACDRLNLVLEKVVGIN